MIYLVGAVITLIVVVALSGYQAMVQPLAVMGLESIRSEA